MSKKEEKSQKEEQEILKCKKIALQKQKFKKNK